jgi:methylaspartate mutase epsilon subunit
MATFKHQQGQQGQQQEQHARQRDDTPHDNARQEKAGLWQGDAHRIAIVGSGPRGLSVLERLAARIIAQGCARRIEIILIDAVQVGAGRVWRTRQADCFLMNTVADEVSAFSGPPDKGPARPGAGPSLAQWWCSVDRNYPGPNSYAPRSLHGRYMQFVLGSIEAMLPLGASLRKVQAWVVDMERAGNGYRLTLAGGATVAADRVILTTGHSLPELEGVQRELDQFASRHSGLRYLRSDASADMPLETIEAGSSVGVIGLGLTFYDVMAALTIGRGGKFVQEDGHLRYQPSGREPVLVAGSRSGLPIPARGRNQKHHDYRYTPLIFTLARARALRQHGQVDFRRDALPLLLAEVNLVYYETSIRLAHGADAAARFRADAAGLAQDVHDLQDALTTLAAGYLSPLPAPIDLDRIAYPFAGTVFADPEAFRLELEAALLQDLAQAQGGNVDSPLKAALDVIRDVRAVVRCLVDFSGLTQSSYRRDFLGWYVPRSSFLSAGPPRYRIEQTLALMRAGLLRIVGPGVKVGCDAEQGCFVLSSPQVGGSATSVTSVVDARVPTPNVALDRAPLTEKLLARGFWTNYAHQGPEAGFLSGGVAVTPAPFHPVDRYNVPNRQLYVLGIPTEHTRWFMQAGSSRPGFWTDFVADADAVAADALLPAVLLPAPSPSQHAQPAAQGLGQGQAVAAMQE